MEAGFFTGIKYYTLADGDMGKITIVFVLYYVQNMIVCQTNSDSATVIPTIIALLAF